MAIEFEAALKIAKDCIAQRTGDENPTVLRYERQENFLFQFRTSQGDLDIIVDPYGEVDHCFQERKAEEEETELTRQDAVRRALDFLGEGKITYLRAKEGGYEVEVDRGDKGPSVLFVDKSGMVHRQKCTVLTRNPELDV